MTNLGRLQKVELRDIWKTEDRDFTPWLAQEQNMAVLSETLMMDLEVEAQEQNVGPFRADILCKDTNDDSWVLIENQLERTDHTHLGQLLTYAAGLDAVTIVWIAAKFTDEHRAALDWLNDHTDDKIRFFGLEVELWKIGESVAAPKFNIISKPNEWTRSISRASSRIESEVVAEFKKMQIEFWTEFVESIKGSKIIKPRKPSAQNWYNVSVGRSGMHLCTTINTRTESITAEVYLPSEDAKAFFFLLHDMKDEFETKLGFPMTWSQQDGRKVCRIYTTLENTDIFDRSKWPDFHKWQAENLEKIYEVFQPHLIKLNADDWMLELSND